MAKKRAGSRIANLIPDHKTSGINPIYLALRGVPHIVEKLSMRPINFLETALQSDVCSQNYGAPKSRESHLARFWDSHSGIPFGAISGLPLGSSGKNSHLDVAFVAIHRVYYKGEGGGLPQV
jgi:hypothetical protein